MNALRSAAFPVRGPAIVVHGGAWDIPDDVLVDHRKGLREAMAAGRDAMASGSTALDIATRVVATLESNGAFDAGCGAMLNQDGRAQLDAGVMDGETLDYASVMAVERCASPVRVARRLLDAGEGAVRMLAGEGAERFAEAEGFDLVENDALICERERKRFESLRASVDDVHTSASFLPGAGVHNRSAQSRAAQNSAGQNGTTQNVAGCDTVGCVVRDEEGRFAAATSTGGTPFKPPGRVGDSPLPGSGFYANRVGAVSSTGWGEAIAAVVLAHSILQSVKNGEEAEQAARDALSEMNRRIRNPDGEGARGGAIVLTGSHAVWAHTTPRMARAVWREGHGTYVEV